MYLGVVIFSAVHVRQFIYFTYLLGIMRKITFTFEPSPFLMKFQGNLLEHIREFEMLEMLRLDFEKGIKVLLGQVTLEEGLKPQDLKWPRFVKVTVLGEKAGKHLVIFYGKAPNDIWRKLMSRMEADVVWTTPAFYKDGKMVLSCIGDEKELKKAIRGMELAGKVSNISYSKAIYQEHNVLSVLTDKQKDILIEAKRVGYYDYPRRVNAEDLAEKMGIAKATVVEHLRKAEGRLMSALLEGYV